MEIADAGSDPKHHKWLERLGIGEPPLEPETWVPVARGFDVDDLDTNSSTEAARLMDLLSDTGIQAEQLPYQIYPRHRSVLSVGDKGVETLMAVMVHNSDRARAIELACEFQRNLELADQPLTDEELTRLAMDAALPPDAEA